MSLHYGLSLSVAAIRSCFVFWFIPPLCQHALPRLSPATSIFLISTSMRHCLLQIGNRAPGHPSRVMNSGAGLARALGHDSDTQNRLLPSSPVGQIDRAVLNAPLDKTGRIGKIDPSAPIAPIAGHGQIKGLLALISGHLDLISLRRALIAGHPGPISL